MKIALLALILLFLPNCTNPASSPEKQPPPMSATTPTVQNAQTQLPHWNSLQKNFDAMLAPDAMFAPYRKVDDLWQLVRRENISDAELALAALKYTAEERENLQKAGEQALFIFSGVTAVAQQSCDLVKVWSAALASDDEHTRWAAGWFLGNLRDRSGDQVFELYTSVLADNPDELPVALVKVICKVDRSQAFLSLITATRNISPEKREQSNRREDELLFAHHMIENADWFLKNNFKPGRDEALKAAIEQLTKLADAPEWWVRYYAAKSVVEFNTGPIPRSELGIEAIIRKLADDKDPTVRKVVQPMQPRSHLKLLRDELAQKMTANDQGKDAMEAIDLVDRLRESLVGKDPSSSPENEETKSAFQNLTAALDAAVQKAGIEVAQALLLDTTGDDYVRQAALRTLTSYQNYKMSQLPLLCRSLLFVQSGTQLFQVPYRGWITVDAARLKLGVWIGYLTGVEITETEGAISAVTLINKPEEWLKAILNKANSAATDPQTKHAISESIQLLTENGDATRAAPRQITK